ANAKCLLFTSIYEEPFGLVMTEAMACGTPVIGFRKGAVPEVIQNGISGYVVDDLHAMCEAVREVEHIEPMTCREYVEEKFGAERMVEEYLWLYRTTINSFDVSGTIPAPYDLARKAAA
ncbi:MAG: glycosyltransferase, partial [Hadesarchaea archaeon]|nr:glycosyltransferase [Hadesarchaea archaeon]